MDVRRIAPGVAQLVAMEQRQNPADDQQHDVVEWSRKGHQSERTTPTNRPRNVGITGTTAFVARTERRRNLAMLVKLGGEPLPRPRIAGASPNDWFKPLARLGAPKRAN